MTEIEKHLDPTSGIDKSWKRNASLAWVKFCFAIARQSSALSIAIAKDQSLDQIPIIVKYLQKYGDATTAFVDLRPYVERLDTAQRREINELLITTKIFDNSEVRVECMDPETSPGPLDQDVSAIQDMMYLNHSPNRAFPVNPNGLLILT